MQDNNLDSAMHLNPAFCLCCFNTYQIALVFTTSVAVLSVLDELKRLMVNSSSAGVDLFLSLTQPYNQNV